MTSLDPSSLRTTFKIEGLWDIVSTDKWDVKFYGLFNYWYDAAVDAEANLRRTIKFEDGSSSGVKEFRRPNCEEEIINEAYLEICVGDLEIRLGKQLISWGETEESRVADVINPLDVTNMVAFPDWENLKVGLWMGRFYYTPLNVWQDLSFELIITAPDFQPTRFPSAGSGIFFPFPVMPQGLFGKVLHKREHDKPANDSSNMEFGLRIRGYTWGTDWALSCFYSRRDTPIVNGQKGSQELLKYVLGLPSDDVYTYPHYTSTALTFSRPWNWLKSTIRGEVVLNSGISYQYGDKNETITAKKKRDLISVAISWDRDNMVPWFSYWNKSRSVITSLTWYHYHLLGHEHNKATGEYIWWESELHRDSTWDVMTLGIGTGLFQDTLVIMGNFAYDFNGGTTIVGILRYKPGDRWVYQLMYQQFNEQGTARMANQVNFTLRYDF